MSSAPVPTVPRKAPPRTVPFEAADPVPGPAETPPPAPASALSPRARDSPALGPPSPGAPQAEAPHGPGGVEGGPAPGPSPGPEGQGPSAVLGSAHAEGLCDGVGPAKEQQLPDEHREHGMAAGEGSLDRGHAGETDPMDQQRPSGPPQSPASGPAPEAQVPACAGACGRTCGRKALSGLRKHGNDTSKSTGCTGRHKAATRRNMRREETVTVQGPVKKQQPDGISHRGGGEGAGRGLVDQHRPPLEAPLPGTSPPAQCSGVHACGRCVGRQARAPMWRCYRGGGDEEQPKQNTQFWTHCPCALVMLAPLGGCCAHRAPEHKKKKEFGMGNFGTTKVCQTMPRDLKVRGHFSGCRF